MSRLGTRGFQIALLLLCLVSVAAIPGRQAVLALNPAAIAGTAVAEEPPPAPASAAHFERISTPDGLPDDVVCAILQYRPKAARMLLQEMTAPRGEGSAEPPPRPGRPKVDPLTERELDVLKLVAHGKSNREIADKLVLSQGTVRTHVSNILSKLHLASRTQATLFALREGLTSLDDAEFSLDPSQNGR